MQVLGCAVLVFVGEAAEDRLPCAELAAFCVHPTYRGAGRTDSLLDYVEQSAREECIRRLFFLSGPAVVSSPDWFLERSFEVRGPAVATCVKLVPLLALLSWQDPRGCSRAPTWTTCRRLSID